MPPQFVTADAQFGTYKLLRPWDGFAASYQGNGSHLYEILFSEPRDNGTYQPLDEMAGSDGYSPLLTSGTSVPMGARCVFHIPLMNPHTPGHPPQTDRYIWKFIWRGRNLFDYRRARKSYHLPRQSPGSPVIVPPHVLIPAVHQTIVMSQAAHNGEQIDTVAVQQFYFDSTSPNWLVDNFVAPGTRGFLEQGIVSSMYAVGAECPYPTYAAIEMQALSDEVIVALRRIHWSGGVFFQNWDLTAAGADREILETIIDTPSGGIWLSVGAAP